MIKKLTFLFALLIGCVAGMRAQAVATLENDELLMGNLTKLHVYVTIPSDSARVDFPLMRQALLEKRKYVGVAGDSVELRTNYGRALEQDSSRTYMRYDIYVQAFDSGRYEIPSLEFLVDGTPVKSNPVDISVIPVKATAEDKIDDFSGLMEPFELNPNPDELAEMEQEGASVFIWCLVGVGLLVLLALVWFFFLRKKGGIFSSKPVPPYVEALNSLKKLNRQNLPAKGKTKEYYTRLSGIVRVYLNRQFGVKTYEKTSAEILAQTEQNRELEGSAPILRNIFDASDYVKFAKQKPSDSENQRFMEEAVRFIEQTRPQETEDKGERTQKGGEK